MNIAQLQQRLADLEERIRPRNSIAARLKRLTPDQRAAYEKWRAMLGQIIADRTLVEIYADLCEGSLPRLRHDVRRILNGEIPVIRTDETISSAENKYRSILEMS